MLPGLLAKFDKLDVISTRVTVESPSIGIQMLGCLDLAMGLCCNPNSSQLPTPHITGRPIVSFLLPFRDHFEEFGNPGHYRRS